MTLHVFNPEHDLALASGLANFTSPKAGRLLRHDLGFLPMIWAQEGDVVLVDDINEALKCWRELNLPVVGKDVTLADRKHLASVCRDASELEVSPWGWDLTIRSELLRCGVSEDRMPDVSKITRIRELSNRAYAVGMLEKLRRFSGTVGASAICHTEEETLDYVAKMTDVVLKAPWSSSGRGVRTIRGGAVDDRLRRWLMNVLSSQGSIETERYCSKTMEFAVEFVSGSDGVKACGLSLFATQNGAYTGNVLASEEEKWRRIGEYIPAMLLEGVISEIEILMSPLLKDVYRGPFGIDMMIVNGEEGYLLNPCVEINLRRTMGHVALALSEYCNHGGMNVRYNDGRYRISL